MYVADRAVQNGCRKGQMSKDMVADRKRGQVMTIDEAIEIYEIRANTHEREAEYHRPLGYSHEAIANVVEMQAREERQIAKWLKELKERKEGE